MIERIVRALEARWNLQDWNIQHTVSREAQLYVVPSAIEARRSSESERFVVRVLRETTAANGKPACGTGNVTLLPGDDIEAALDTAALKAGLVRNSPYTLPGPAALPDVPLADPDVQGDAASTLESLLARLQEAVAQHAPVRLTAAEFFTCEDTTRLINSRGIDATQTATKIDVEWVLVSRADDGRETESFVEMRRRRAVDIPIEGEVAERARQAADLLVAQSPREFRGPTVLHGHVLANVLNSGVIQTRAGGAAQYNRLSNWSVGETVLPGDSTTIYANRALPFGTHSSRFDNDGLPGQRIELVRDGKLKAVVADARYATYLSVPATGAFGNIEVPHGTYAPADLLREPYVEIAAFSWFNPDPITGDFSSEIRLGYFVQNGQRIPFKGGSLVGNVIQALGDVCWSTETGFFGDYQGPVLARFGNLSVIS